jgi:capsular polysaccharide transport system permease protein
MDESETERLSQPLAGKGDMGFFKRYPIVTLALVVALLGTTYWSLIASDRYVSEAQVIVQKADLAVPQGLDFGMLLGSIGGGDSHQDQMLLRAHLLSVDMLRKLDKELGLREHYSASSHDLLSRMWAVDEPIEWFHKYLLSRVSVEYDDYSGVLLVNSQAFTPEMAQAITQMMLSEGERFMNEMSHRLASEQVAFLENQLGRLEQRAQAARNAVIQFQNQSEMVSPQAALESRIALIAKLEVTRADLQTRLSAMKAYLVESNPAIEQINQQIAAIQKQVEQEQRELASTQEGATLNRRLEQYQRLELEATFAEETYKSALTALEAGRVEASRKLKKVSVLQTPTLPEYPQQPERFYNSVVVILFSLIAAGLIHLMAAVVRDHKD